MKKISPSRNSDWKRKTWQWRINENLMAKADFFLLDKGQSPFSNQMYSKARIAAGKRTLY